MLTSSVAATPTQRRLHSVKPTADILGIGPWGVRRLFYAGKLRGHLVLGKLMFSDEDIDHLIRQSVVEHTPATSGIGVIAPPLNRARAQARAEATARRKSRTPRSGSKTTTA